MKKWMFFLIVIMGIMSCHSVPKEIKVASPDGNIVLQAGTETGGVVYYKVDYKGKTVIDTSGLGILGKNLNLTKGFEVSDVVYNSHKGSWKPVLGEVAEIVENYNEMKLSLKAESGLKMDVIFRVFDDGLGFRYHIPKQGTNDTLTVLDEVSEFALTADHQSWWIPGDYDSNEHVYSTSKLSEIDAFAYNAPSYEKKIYTQHIVLPKAVQTPFTMKAADGVHLCIHEAALKDFPALHLNYMGSNVMKAQLIPSADSTVKSINVLPFTSPWRSVNITDDAAGLLNSKLILNLNDPCALAETSWIKAQKYVGIWWLMHIGKASWDYAGGSKDGKPHGRHGATTENTKKYIDFAAQHGFDGVLVEGWNVGWEDWFGKWQDSVFNFSQPYPDYNIDELSKYAADKGVKIIMHHETSSAVTNYEKQMESAYQFMNKYGINTVKTGYVGKIIPKGEWHDGQWMVNHYLRVAKATADHKIMVNMHESHRPAGMNRTYPNWLSCEASRGMEFNAWSAGNPPEHETILPFTRIMGGGFDYTPGIFETRMNVHDKNKKEIVHTTVAKQLALYVTLYSPLQMAADLPEMYEKRMDVFQFIKDVPVDWQDTRVLNAEVGDYVSIARKDKFSQNWFIGSISDEKARKFEFKLDFLDEGASYEATLYEDGEGSHWQNNPYPVKISKRKIKKGDVLMVNLAEGGGTAISLMKQ
ncbi:MAG: glycoside hydrolase family 97 protein [Saprospiraceae bacterium]|nr:glycoside hydrolase family 97 protein [Saprospiraceae bacterium]